MKVLILDIGNTHTKCYVFDVEDSSCVAEIHGEHTQTNRGHPWDLVDTVRNMLKRAIDAHKPDYGMITAFGDAFVHYDPADNGRPRFVFPDEPVNPASFDTGIYELDADYATTGFPTGNIEITGVRSLRMKHRADWMNIVPVNIAILNKKLGLTLRNCRVVVSPHGDTTPSELCVRLSPHIALQLSVAINALGHRPLLL